MYSLSGSSTASTDVRGVVRSTMLWVRLCHLTCHHSSPGPERETMFHLSRELWMLENLWKMLLMKRRMRVKRTVVMSMRVTVVRRKMKSPRMIRKI